MKCAVILYHKNALKLYKQRWIEKCVASIENQSYKEFHVYDLCYGNENQNLGAILGRNLEFNSYEHLNIRLLNHVWAQNFLLNKAFKEDGMDFVFNVNLDDYYAPTRFGTELTWLHNGYDLVSSNFVYIEEDDQNEDRTTLILLVSLKDIKKHLMLGDNPICHPGVAYSKAFWLTHGPYPDAIPREDLLLWQMAINAGANFCIVPQILVYYRRHPNQVCK